MQPRVTQTLQAVARENFVGESTEGTGQEDSNVDENSSDTIRRIIAWSSLFQLIRHY